MDKDRPGLLRQLYWELKDPHSRFLYWQKLLMDVPGRFGQLLRWKVYRKHFGKVGSYATIHVDVRIRNIQYLELGEGCHLGESNMLQAGGGIEMGDNVLLGPGVKIWSANHVFDDVETPIIDQGFEYKRVIIGSNVWIGANAFIMPGAVIGDGCVISAGSVIGGKTIPPYKILAGNPARIIGSREPKNSEVENKQDT